MNRLKGKFIDAGAYTKLSRAAASAGTGMLASTIRHCVLIYGLLGTLALYVWCDISER